ncbi:MBL fold metallo-hydrolase [Bacillus tropicus]|uniref:MBL fold metallo-hydrolase n=1 Tax=Bacillus tropicus TaxID=2026188 RepID=UPI0011AB2556|nr:MBL fold metallo-hydrolase [Bacillus tropicus]
MLNYICTTCGVQYSKSQEVPSDCIICNEERQYINPSGQSWTTLEKMQKSKLYKNEILKEETGLYSITTKPEFAIGQTAYLIQSQNFNVLWDCITYLDENTIQEIHKLGGIQAIVLSHPHYYSTQVEWAETFNIPIYIHEDDKEWVNRSSEQIIFWSGESLVLTDAITIYRLGGHFKGGAILHWKDGSDKKGLLLTGDIIQVVADRQWVSFMYSYPNLIPLPANKVKEMVDKIKDLRFNRLYNAFHRVIVEDANKSVQKSADRYIKALQGKLFHT